MTRVKNQQSKTTRQKEIDWNKVDAETGIDYRDYERKGHCYLRQGWCELNLKHGTNKKNVRRPKGDENIHM